MGYKLYPLSLIEKGYYIISISHQDQGYPTLLCLINVVVGYNFGKNNRRGDLNKRYHGKLGSKLINVVTLINSGIFFQKE